MAYGLLCGAFYCINLLSEDFEMVSWTILYKRSLYLNLKLKAKAKQDDATRFTWFSAACSYQRFETLFFRDNLKSIIGSILHINYSDAGHVGSGVNFEGGTDHLLKPGQLKSTLLHC